jgi:hypothetical protein
MLQNSSINCAVLSGNRNTVCSIKDGEAFKTAIMPSPMVQGQYPTVGNVFDKPLFSPDTTFKYLISVINVVSAGFIVD